MTTARARALAALPLLLLATSCSTSIPIDVTREVEVSSGAGTIELAELVDLSAEGEVWDRRDDLDALHLDRVRIEVLELLPGNGATAADVLVTFRPEGGPADGSADVAVGAVEGASLAAGAVIVVPGSRAVDAFLASVLAGDGRFGVHVTATVDQPLAARLSVRLQGSVDVKLF